MKKDRTRILIVDDEPTICEIVAFNLEIAGFEAVTAHSAIEALGMALDDFDLILLDVMMSEMNGFEMARIVKSSDATRRVPIVFMTAKSDEDDVLKGFELGADDYIEKPFSIKELVARVKAVIARSNAMTATGDNVLIYKGITLNLDAVTLTIDNQPVPLSKLEFDILKTFLLHKGQALTRKELIDSAWPDNVFVSNRTVDVSINRVRRKLGPYSTSIVTKIGIGYCFE